MNQKTVMKNTMLSRQDTERRPEKLNWHKQIERPRAIEAITHAGDFSDSQESRQYSRIPENQQIIQQRIVRSERKHADAEIVDIERTYEIR